MPPHDRPPLRTWFVLPAHTPLPEVCPACLAPGTRPLGIGAHRRPAPSWAVAFYCDSCAAVLDRAGTRAWARRVAAGLLGVSTASVVVLHFGTRALNVQVLLCVFAALAVPCAFWLLPGARSQPALSYEHGEPHTFSASRCDYVALLGVVTITPPTAVPSARFPWSDFLPTLLTLTVWSLAQFFGRAELWVVHSQQDLLLLIDDRLAGDVPASLEETPLAGRREALLGGPRQLALLQRSGRIEAEQQVTVFPGRAYLFGQAPPGRCFWLETRLYGQDAAQRPTSSFVRLEGTGPVWELRAPVDFWFVPLPEPGLSWTSGGSQTALRTLPCAAK